MSLTAQIEKKEVLLQALRELRYKRIPTASRKSSLTETEVMRAHVHPPVVLTTATSPSLSATPTSGRSQLANSTTSNRVEGECAGKLANHYLRSTLTSREHVVSSGCSGADAACTELPERRVDRPLTQAEEKIALRLYTTQLRPTNTPKPPPCVAASSARRTDFTQRHAGSAPPRKIIADEEYTHHFFHEGMRRKVEAASTRDKQDLLAHDKMHHTIDKGAKLDTVDTEGLIRRLKEDAVTQKERDYARLSEKYVDRIRKRGCPQPPGRRRRHRASKSPSSPKKPVIVSALANDALITA